MRARISSCVTIGRPKMRSILSGSFAACFRLNRHDQTAARVFSHGAPLILSTADHPEDAFRGDDERNTTALVPAHLHVGENILKFLAFPAHATRMDPIARLPRPDDQRCRQ